MATLQAGLRLSKTAFAINLFLAAGKTLTGFLGRSNALIADGIESMADVLSSLVVWGGLRVSAKPADSDHPYGHGKAEAVAGVIVSLMLLGAAMLIAIQSGREILSPNPLSPRWFTLPVLLGVIVIKESLYRVVLKAGRSLGSTALTGEAWHQRSDALTSAAAFIGISIALVGGAGFETADDWAALAACLVIAYNGLRLLRTALDEVMDAAVGPELTQRVRAVAASVPGVEAIEKCRVRKAGLHYSLDIHVVVDGRLTVHEGHEISHQVKDRLLGSDLRVNDVIVHIEPSNPHHPARASRSLGGG